MTTFLVYATTLLDGELPVEVSQADAELLARVMRRTRLARVRRHGPAKARRWVLTPRNEAEWPAWAR